jgi:mycothiol synthase
MIIRTYRPSDAEAVMRVIAAAAAQDRTRSVSLSSFERTWEVYSPDPLHPRYDESAVVTDNGEVCGFAWWSLDLPGKLSLEGWVAPEQRRRGVGTALLTAVDRYVQQYLRGSVIISARAYADIGGIEALFALKGYRQGHPWYLMRTRLQNRVLHTELPAGITVKAFNAGQLERLVDADNVIFQDHWGAKQRSTSVFRAQMIEARPHDPKLWLLAWSGDELVGECLCHANHFGEPNDGWVSALGVRHEYRGRGLGRALLMLGLQRLQDRGFDTASLSVDSENSAAVNLYRSLGMDVIRTRLSFEKTVTINA